MKFTLGWLQRHLETAASADDISEVLSRIGLEVEALTSRAAPLAAFRVAHVIAAAPHPNADRLRVCQVDTGEGVIEVVCGAPNARAGIKAVFAPPGSVIPATGATLRVGEIRGVRSNGMLLSLREMNLGEDHDGIVELPADAPTGMAYAEFSGLDDPLFEIAVTPNRGDCLGVRGIARDLAAAGLGRLLPWQPPAVAATGDSPVTWRLDWPEACPHVLVRAVRGVRNGPGPAWLARLLTAVGLRPISALVDITNFFTLDLGRPLHVFDISRLRGPVLTLRRGAGNETLAALDGRTYALDTEDCVIADAGGAVSLAGIIGGAATGCVAETTDVFLECAAFDPVRIGLSGRRHHISSDARQRFERGIDLGLMPAALDAATAMVIALCGGTASAATAAGTRPDRARTARLTHARLARLAGEPVPAEASLALLRGLGFEPVAQDAASASFRVPSWRNDIAAGTVLDPAPGLDPARLAEARAGAEVMEPEADLAEEVLRLRGLDRIAPVSLPVGDAVPRATLSPAQIRTQRARRVLAERGLLECVTFSFTDARTAALFGAAAPITLANPIAADLDTMRPTALATLALAASRNLARGQVAPALFEIGPAFQGVTVAGQRREAAGLRCGTSPRHWRDPARVVDAFDAKADLFALLAALGLPMESLSVTPDAPSWYHPGQSGTVRQGPKLVLGHFGSLHPALTAALDLPATVGFVLHLHAVPEPKRRRRAAPELPNLQPVRRDFAFVCAADTAAETLLRAVRGAERGLIGQVTLFDRFELPDGKISLGVEVVLQPRDHTLTDAEIESVAAKIVAAAGKATGAGLR